VITDPAALRFERGGVILAASDHGLMPGQADSLVEFVRRGGGVVLLGGTLAAWNAQGGIAELARWMPSGPGPMTELVLQVESSHPVTARLGGELRLTDELYLSEGPPADASILLRTSWRFTDQVVAYERELGGGRFFHLGWGTRPPLMKTSRFKSWFIVPCCLRQGRGRRLRLVSGCWGTGRSHVTRCVDHRRRWTSLERSLRYVIRTQRAGGTRLVRPVYATASDLFDDPDTGLVVVGTPPAAHVDAVLGL